MNTTEFNTEKNDEDFRPFVENELIMVLGGGGDEQLLHQLKEEYRYDLNQDNRTQF
ncbi:hypothetical protein [Pedobacter sp. L105]|uniref:hypothetical protein n=1 Tax=Pedobacter sp. L105 TaxID=1641871 RepID=UPI00131ABE1D|nr:hypothetical protein [Pedobacter sp. L105]